MIVPGSNRAEGDVRVGAATVHWRGRGADRRSTCCMAFGGCFHDARRITGEFRERYVAPLLDPGAAARIEAFR